MRAPAKKKNVQEKKKKESAEDKDKQAETRYLPYIPPAYVVDTVAFFKDKSKVDNLLSLIFSPQNATDTYEDRVEYQKKFEMYQILKEGVCTFRGTHVVTMYREEGKCAEENEDECSCQFVHVYTLREDKKYNKHLEKMREKVFKSIANLPEELYDESIKGGELLDNKEIQFGLKYENDLLKHLSNYKKKLLHVYKILLHLRYPFYLIKKKNPMLFYISESKAVSRQKQINTQRKKLKKK
ncbi:hypothetical protein POVCU1_010830 [Plasmodium ovale curtisi]|uniref:Uncharacterized protein n=1 Tax=Plasmodium ovale curtisi TaxID=864141 RepID=A0A1A8VV80_PLAOA|nr:hypothetical protein POVCU1_010830 [Plasmodium ovale curtisi]